jgi:hypothetical protein
MAFSIRWNIDEFIAKGGGMMEILTPQEHDALINKIWMLKCWRDKKPIKAARAIQKIIDRIVPDQFKVSYHVCGDIFDHYSYYKKDEFLKSLGANSEKY